MFPPSPTTIGLRHQTNDGVTSLMKGLKGGNRIGRGAPIKDLHSRILRLSSGFTGDGQSIHPDMGADALVRHLGIGFKMHDAIENLADITRNGG